MARSDQALAQVVRQWPRGERFSKSLERLSSHPLEFGLMVDQAKRDMALELRYGIQ